MTKVQISKYGGVDIGSNAIRLLVSYVYEQEGLAPIFRKDSLVRVPIRLGADVFMNAKVSEHNIQRMSKAMQAYALLLKAHEVEHFRICATSAMREAENRAEVIARIKQESGFEIEVIDGEDEAQIIAQTDLFDLLQSRKNFLYVDVGGGSTELTFYSQGKQIGSQSFNLGTIRLMKEKNTTAERARMKEWILKTTKSYKAIALIGSGGNINHIYKYSGRGMDKPLSYKYLLDYYETINATTYSERIMQWNMKPDRADVVVPATSIYVKAMEWSNAKKLYVPKIGLADGIIKGLYQEHKA